MSSESQPSRAVLRQRALVGGYVKHGVAANARTVTPEALDDPLAIAVLAAVHRAEATGHPVTPQAVIAQFIAAGAHRIHGIEGCRSVLESPLLAQITPGHLPAIEEAVLQEPSPELPADQSARHHSEGPSLTVTESSAPGAVPFTARDDLEEAPPAPSFRQPEPITLESVARSTGSSSLTLESATIDGPGLLALPIEPRPALLGEWFREGDLGYVFAPRGHGKTWLAMLLANAVAEGGPLGPWKNPGEPRSVLYLDAEMNLADVQERARLIGIESSLFRWLQCERVFDAIERSLNIADEDDQQAIDDLLGDGDVLVIDNLSTAAAGIEENNNDHFDRLKGWLLRLRHRRISVVIVHHAGRNGSMRGASRREDPAHWIIGLKDDSGDGDTKTFITAFAKCRNCPVTSAPPMRWTMSTRSGRLTLTWEKHGGPEAMLALIRSGVGSASEIAEELAVSKGTISKWAKALLEQCPPVIAKKGRDYVPVEPPTVTEE